MQVARYQLFHDVGSCRIETSPLICSANQWPGSCIIGTSVMKDSSSTSKYTENLFLYIVKHNLLFLFLFFFLSGFSFTNIHDSQDSRQRGRLSSCILSTTSTHFTVIQRLAGLLLQRARLCIQLAAGIEHGTFGTRSLEFTLSTLALVAAVVSRMLKTQVTLRNISCALLNLTKRLIFAMPKDLSSFPMFAQLTVIFSLQFTNYGCFSP